MSALPLRAGLEYRVTVFAHTDMFDFRGGFARLHTTCRNVASDVQPRPKCTELSSADLCLCHCCTHYHAYSLCVCCMGLSIPRLGEALTQLCHASSPHKVVADNVRRSRSVYVCSSTMYIKVGALDVCSHFWHICLHARAILRAKPMWARLAEAPFDRCWERAADAR